MNNINSANSEEVYADLWNEDEAAQSPIRNYFKGKTIFLTGAIGFLGQLVLEKLLRCGAERVFILARAKKNKPPLERLKQLFDSEVYIKLRNYNPTFMQQLTVVEGDLSALRLGIKTSDLELMENTVQIVLHAAADVRFQENLLDLIKTNLRGTRELLEISKNFRKMQVFNYISTAYSNCPHGRCIKEKFYGTPIDPETMIALAERCSQNPEDVQNTELLTERLLGDWPNTYTFSKSLSEELVSRYGHILPICIVRPSIVIATNADPLPGWTNNIFGMTGVMAGMGTGFIRTYLANTKYHYDAVCADYAVNAILATTWATDGNNKTQGTKILDDSSLVSKSKPKIYAIVSSHKLLLSNILSLYSDYGRKHPIVRSIWIRCDNPTTSTFLFWYLSLFYHFMATAIMDCGLKVLGRKERLLPMFRKTQEFLKVLGYFSTNEWEFDNSNMLDLCDRMHPIDKKLFLCDTRLFKFSAYAFTYAQGITKYILNDRAIDRTKALAQYKQQKFAHYFAQIGFYFLQLIIFFVFAEGLGLIRCFKNALIS